jgi:hypothetical protein
MSESQSFYPLSEIIRKRRMLSVQIEQWYERLKYYRIEEYPFILYREYKDMKLHVELEVEIKLTIEDPGSLENPNTQTVFNSMKVKKYTETNPEFCQFYFMSTIVLARVHWRELVRANFTLEPLRRIQIPKNCSPLSLESLC